MKINCLGAIFYTVRAVYQCLNKYHIVIAKVKKKLNLNFMFNTFKDKNY